MDEIITDSPWWMKKHDMFPENKLKEHEKSDVLSMAVVRLQKESIDNYVDFLQRMCECIGFIDQSHQAI
jgi:hypothetical protein